MHNALLIRVGCLIGIFGAAITIPSPLLRAQDAGSRAGQLWKEAQSSFASGNYAQAASSLEEIIKASKATTTWMFDNTVATPLPPNRQWLEPVFFMLGASFFNAKDWPNAIGVLKRYQQLFPQSARLAQVDYSLGQADFLGGHPEDAIVLFKSLLSNPNYHVKAVLFLVECYKQTKQAADAISLLEREKSQPNLNPDFLVKIDALLLPLYLDAGTEDKALQVLEQMDAEIAHVQDVTVFNALAIRLGDLRLKKNDITAALACYRRVRDNEQIIELQNQQIESLQQRRAANLASIQANPLNSVQLQLDNKEIDAQVAKDQQILAQYRTLPPVLPPLYLRIARAYSAEESLWEAAVVYRELLRRWPHCADAESALYGTIILFDRLKQTDRGLELCQSYLTQYPQGKYANSVGFLRGAMAYDAQDYDQAAAYFEDTLAKQPNNPRREQIEVILGDINLQVGQFDKAIACYEQYEKDFPNGGLLEKAEYRRALALLFGGKSDDANQAIDAYLQKYPSGAYVADAEYRLAVIEFAAKQYDQALSDCKAWQKKHGNAEPVAEVLSLMGDCYESEDRHEEAVSAYIKSYKAASTKEVLNYSIMAAAKILQKQAKWADIAAMFTEFIKNNPDHPTVVSAIFWIGRADIKLGKVEEGKQYMADTAKQYLNDPTREAVDEIITQLALLYAHKHPPPATAPVATAPAPVGGTAAAVAAAAPVFPSAPAPPEPDPATALADILTVPDLDSKPTARARIHFAKAELARLQRKPEVEAEVLLAIANESHPEDLSPILLGQVGDCLFQNGQPDRAIPFYNQLMDIYDKSPLVDYAYNGLAQIAFAQKDYKKADHYFSKALDKGLAASKVKEITLGEARTLLALNRPEAAKPLFEQVASNRAWRGEATALSVYYLGDIQMDQGKLPEANAYYQRVFVAYQKYPAIQAKAYLRSGEVFEKLGRNPEAINTYTEMLNNPNLLSYPEAAEAKQRLQQLAQK
jgi:TolA-binding protein